MTKVILLTHYVQYLSADLDNQVVPFESGEHCQRGCYELHDLPIRDLPIFPSPGVRS